MKNYEKSLSLEGKAKAKQTENKLINRNRKRTKKNFLSEAAINCPLPNVVCLCVLMLELSTLAIKIQIDECTESQSARIGTIKSKQEERNCSTGQTIKRKMIENE